MQTVYNDFPQTFNSDSSTWWRCENSFDHAGHPLCLIPFLSQGCKPRNQFICLNPIIFFYFIDKICTVVRAEYSITPKSYLGIVSKLLMNVFLQHQQTKALSTLQLKIQMTNQSGASTSPNPELQNNKSAIYKEIESDNSSDFASCNPSVQFLSTPEHPSWQRTRA